MLLHKRCETPVELLEDNFEEVVFMRYYCSTCDEEITDDLTELLVVDSIRMLQEMAQ